MLNCLLLLCFLSLRVSGMTNKSTLLTDPEHACSLIHRQLVDMCQRQQIYMFYPKSSPPPPHPSDKASINWTTWLLRYSSLCREAQPPSTTESQQDTHNDTNGLRKTNDFKCEHQFLSWKNCLCGFWAPAPSSSHLSLNDSNSHFPAARALINWTTTRVFVEDALNTKENKNVADEANRNTSLANVWRKCCAMI